MIPFTSLKQFARAVLAGALVLGAGAASAQVSPAMVTLAQVTPQVAVAGQIAPHQLATLKAQGYSAIVALRPDGEADGQPTANEVGAAARALGLSFTYIPVSPGTIPDAAVSALGAALGGQQGKILLYCRSGSRAARTWALAEASRPGGAEAEAILAAVKAGNQSADDLRAAIASRIGARP